MISVDLSILNLFYSNKFWFAYINRWRIELKDLETLSIGMVVLINAVKNKDFSPKKNLSSYRKELNHILTSHKGHSMQFDI